MNMTPFSGILPIFYKGNANRVEYKIKGREMDFYFYFRGEPALCKGKQNFLYSPIGFLSQGFRLSLSASGP